LENVYPEFWKMNDTARAALLSSNDLQWIMTCISRDLRMTFDIGKSDQWNGLAWSNTLLHEGKDDFTSGWTFALHLRMKDPLTPAILREHLLLSRVHVGQGEHRMSGLDNNGRNIVLRCYLLADDFATLMFWRKSIGMDTEPGPTHSRPPKNIVSRV
jgi:hypothetical protein